MKHYFVKSADVHSQTGLSLLARWSRLLADMLWIPQVM